MVKTFLLTEPSVDSVTLLEPSTLRKIIAELIESLILSGVSTEGGIEGSARHGVYLGFIPVIAQDAVGSFDQQVHERVLEIMRRMFEVETTAAIIKNMESQRTA